MSYLHGETGAASPVIHILFPSPFKQQVPSPSSIIGYRTENRLNGQKQSDDGRDGNTRTNSRAYTVYKSFTNIFSGADIKQRKTIKTLVSRGLFSNC